MSIPSIPVPEPPQLVEDAAIDKPWRGETNQNQKLKIIPPFTGSGSPSSAKFIIKLNDFFDENSIDSSTRHHIGIGLLKGIAKAKYQELFARSRDPKTWSGFIEFLHTHFGPCNEPTLLSHKCVNELSQLKQEPDESATSFGKRFKAWKITADRVQHCFKHLIQMFIKRLHQDLQIGMKQWQQQSHTTRPSLDEAIETAVALQEGRDPLSLGSVFTELKGQKRKLPLEPGVPTSVARRSVSATVSATVCQNCRILGHSPGSWKVWKCPLEPTERMMTTLFNEALRTPKLRSQIEAQENPRVYFRQMILDSRRSLPDTVSTPWPTKKSKPNLGAGHHHRPVSSFRPTANVGHRQLPAKPIT